MPIFYLAALPCFRSLYLSLLGYVSYSEEHLWELRCEPAVFGILWGLRSEECFSAFWGFYWFVQLFKIISYAFGSFVLSEMCPFPQVFKLAKKKSCFRFYKIVLETVIAACLIFSGFCSVFSRVLLCSQAWNLRQSSCLRCASPGPDLVCCL